MEGDVDLGRGELGFQTLHGSLCGVECGFKEFILLTKDFDRGWF